MYQVEENVDIKTDHSYIDHYWCKIFQFLLVKGGNKYSILNKLVKSVLSLHNINADVERSVSDKKNTCTAKSKNILH